MELNKKNIKKIILLITFALLLFWCVNHIEQVKEILSNFFNVLSPIIIGLCLAFVFNILLKPFEKYWDRIFKKKLNKPVIQKLRRPVCLVLSVLVFLGAIFILLFMIIPQIGDTLSVIISSLPQYLTELEAWWNNIIVMLSDFGIVLPEFDFDISKLIEKLTSLFATSGLIDKTYSFTSGLLGAVFDVILGFVFSIYVLAMKEKICNVSRDIIYAIMPKNTADRTVEITAISNKTFTNFLTGQLMEAVIIGVLCFIGMLIFRFPYPLVISVLVGFTALIPYFGAFFGTAIGALFIVMENPAKAFWFIVFIIILQQIEGNLIYPKVVGKSVGMPGLLVMASVTLGGGFGGILGMIFAVPIVSVIYTICAEFLSKKNQDKITEKAE